MEQLGQKQTELILNQLASLEEHLTGKEFFSLWKKMDCWIQAGYFDCIIKLLEVNKDELPVAQAFLMVLLFKNGEYPASNQYFHNLQNTLPQLNLFWQGLHFYLLNKEFVEMEKAFGDEEPGTSNQ